MKNVVYEEVLSPQIPSHPNPTHHRGNGPKESRPIYPTKRKRDHMGNPAEFKPGKVLKYVFEI